MWQPPPLPRTFEAALRDLDDTSTKVRASAIRDLTRYSESDERPRVVRELLRALRDGEAEVRTAAASALGEVADDEALPGLMVAVDDEHPLVRQMAIDALGSFRDGRAAERLRRALADDRPEVRFQAAMALPRLLDDDEADEVLARCCRDADGGVRYIALRVAEERFEGCPTEPRRSLDAARAALRDELPQARVAAALYLASRGDRGGVDVLLDVIENRLQTPERDDEAAAVEAAGALGLAQATAALERRAYGLGRLLREQCSFHARVSLARLGHARARADILRGLDAWSFSARTEAAHAAGKARLIEARPMLEVLADHPGRADPAVVRDALEALARRG